MALAKPVSQEKLAEYCRANGIKWLAAHDAEIVQRNFPDVDLFLLVEFEKDCRIGYMTLLRIERTSVPVRQSQYRPAHAAGIA